MWASRQGAAADTPELSASTACAPADSGCSSDGRGEAEARAPGPKARRGRCYPPPQCQVPGCEAELCTPYCIRRRLCTTHMRLDAVLRRGHSKQQLWRFCFQCGKLEQLELFDGNKRSCRTRLQKRLKLGKAVKSSKQKSTSSKHRKPDGDKLQQEERQLVSEAESSGCNTGCCLAQLGQQQHPAAAPRQSQLLQKQQMWQQQQWQQQRQQQGRRQDNAAQLSSTWDSRDAYGATTCHGSSSGTSWQSGSGAMPAWVAAAPCTVWRHDPAVGLLPPRCPSFTGGGSGGSSTCLDQQCSWWDAPEPQVQQAAALARIRGLPQQVPAPLWALPPHTPLGLSMQQQQTLLAAPHAHAPLEQPAQPPWVHPQPWSNGAVCMSPSSSVASTLTPAIDGAQHVQHVQQQRQSSCSVACGCCLPAAAPAAKFMAAERGCAPAAPGPSSTPGILQLLEQESTQLLAEYTDALHDVLACLGPDCAL